MKTFHIKFTYAKQDWQMERIRKTMPFGIYDWSMRDWEPENKTVMSETRCAHICRKEALEIVVLVSPSTCDGSAIQLHNEQSQRVRSLSWQLLKHFKELINEPNTLLDEGSSLNQLKRVRGTYVPCYEPDSYSEKTLSFCPAICKQDDDCYSERHIAPTEEWKIKLKPGRVTRDECGVVLGGLPEMIQRQHWLTGQSHWMKN